MKTVIMAGGKGSRMGPMSADIPKPMLPIEGKPILEHEINCLRAQGFTDIIITVSYFGDVIKDYFTDGKKWGVSLQYFDEPLPLGNAGALFKLRPYLQEDFLLLNADIIFNVKLSRLVDYHYKKGGWATILGYANNHPEDSGLLITDEHNRIIQWFTKEERRPEWYKNCVNGGLHIISPLALDAVINNLTENSGPAGQKIIRADLDRQVLKPLCKTGKIFCYKSPEYVQDMGTPERYARVCEDVRSGLVKSRDFSHPQRAIFLDGYGIISCRVSGKGNPETFELLPGATKAVRKINEKGWFVILLTPPPVTCAEQPAPEEVVQFHNKIETLLGREGAFVDQIYMYPSRLCMREQEYAPKIFYPCAAPNPAILLQAAGELHIDLSQSWVWGTNPKYIHIGKSAGCKTCFIGTGAFGQDKTALSLSIAAEQIL